MDRLEKYEAVNATESLKELAKVIESFADEDGFIQGRQKRFDAKIMAYYCINYDTSIHNSLTREFGIRQQAMMLSYYEKNGIY